MGSMKTFWGDGEGQGHPDPSKKKKEKKIELTLSTQPISGKFYTCFPLFFPKVELLISLSALSRLLDWFPQEEKHTTRECAAFTSFTHPCTLCQTRVAVWLRGAKRCSPARMCLCWSEKGGSCDWNGEVSTSPHVHKRAHTHQALRASVMTVPVAGFCGASQPVCAMRVTQPFKGWNTCAYMTLTWRPWKSFDAFVLPVGPPRHCAPRRRAQAGEDATCWGVPCQAGGQITQQRASST